MPIQLTFDPTKRLIMPPDDTPVITTQKQVLAELLTKIKSEKPENTQVTQKRKRGSEKRQETPGITGDEMRRVI